MKIFCIYTATLTCIMTYSFSGFQNNGCPGSSDVCSFRHLSALLNKNRTKKMITRSSFSSDLNIIVSKIVAANKWHLESLNYMCIYIYMVFLTDWFFEVTKKSWNLQCHISFWLFAFISHHIYLNQSFM